jgi:hypothetical protein
MDAGDCGREASMEWDLGVIGLATMLGMAVAFGLLSQLFAGGATTRWLWPIASAVYFVSGLLISEAWFGWATDEELQPNIDGLSFDETLLALVPGIAAVVIVRRLSKRPEKAARGLEGWIHKQSS